MRIAKQKDSEQRFWKKFNIALDYLLDYKIFTYFDNWKLQNLLVV